MSARILAFTRLLAFVSALPSGLHSTLSERSPDRSECWRTEPGSSFYNCFGYVGCFYSDPCSLPHRPSSTTLPTPEPPKTHEITRPRSYNIYVLSEALRDEEDSSSHVDLEKPEGSGITKTTAMVFENVPKGAKNCRIMWRSAARNDRSVFFVEGQGQAWVRQLNGFPTKPERVTFDGLKKYQDPEAEWSAGLDFTGWPESPGTHNGPYVNCAERIGIELKGSDQGEALNQVYIVLTDTDGIYLTYEL